jgi:hypothetical protein
MTETVSVLRTFPGSSFSSVRNLRRAAEVLGGAVIIRIDGTWVDESLEEMVVLQAKMPVVTLRNVRLKATIYGRERSLRACNDPHLEPEDQPRIYVSVTLPKEVDQGVLV